MGTMGRRRTEILLDGFMNSLFFLSRPRHLYGSKDPWTDTRIRKNNAIEECTHPRILTPVVLAAAHRCPRTTHYYLRRSGEGRSPGIRAHCARLFAWIPAYAGTTATKLRNRESTAHPRRPCECCILKTTAAADPPSRAYESENSPRTAP